MQKVKNASRRSEIITAYTMLAPDILGLMVFVFVPIIFAFYVSLHNWNGFGAMKFINLDNYGAMLRDSDFWKSLWITIKYTLMYVPSVFVLSLLTALLVNSLSGRYKEFIRTLYFSPYAISTVVAALTWGFLYDPYNGYINKILVLFGIDPLAFTAVPDQALISVTIVSVWMVCGYNMIIFVAGINEIPRTYYEAAVIDGANAMEQFLKITLPLLKNTSVFILTVTTIGSFQVFDQVKVLTNGGPAFATSVSVYYIFQQAFEANKFGYSSAIAFVLFIVIVLITMIQFKVVNSKKTDD